MLNLKNNILSFTLVVGIVFLLISCSKSHDLDIDKITSISVTHLGDKDILNDLIEFGSGTPELSNTKKWLRRNKDGWESYLVTEPVGKLLISGHGFRLNIGESWVIMIFIDDEGESHQLTKTISPVEFNYLDKSKTYL
jgi:hypothetical protein